MKMLHCIKCGSPWGFPMCVAEVTRRNLCPFCRHETNTDERRKIDQAFKEYQMASYSCRACGATVQVNDKI